MAAPVIIATPGARLACVLIHGRGQGPDDIAALSGLAVAAGAQVVMPVADGKSWYAARAVDPMTDRTAAELDASLDQVARAMDIAGQGGLPVLLAGFSQGACLAAEYLFRRGGAAGACLFTGARVGGPGAPVRALGGLSVYASGSDADPWIPPAAFQDLQSDLTQSGARLRADTFPGRPHVVSSPELAALSGMLSALANGQEIFL